MKKRLLSIPLVALCIAWIVLFNACSNKKIGSTDGNGKEWLSWTIVFKPGATNKQIATTLGELDNYLLDYIKEADPNHNLVYSANVSRKIIFGNPNNGFSLDLTWDPRASEGTRVRVKPPRPPKRDLFTNPDIFDIKSR